LLLSISFVLFSHAEEIKNSDIRIEILSQIKVYKEKIEKLKDMHKIAVTDDEKKMIQQYIKLLNRKIKKLKETLEKYEKNLSPVG
jgi:rubrerythrin